MSDINYHAYIRSTPWYKRRREAFKLWKGRCALLPFLKAENYHHLTYDNLGHEYPIRDCIPLSRFAHWLVHRKCFWAKRKKFSFRRVFWGRVWRHWATITLILLRPF